MSKHKHLRSKITSNQRYYKEKAYIGSRKVHFKDSFNNHIKSFNLKQYENNTAIRGILGNKTQPFHTKSHLENNKEMCTLTHMYKKIMPVS